MSDNTPNRHTHISLDDMVIRSPDSINEADTSPRLTVGTSGHKRYILRAGTGIFILTPGVYKIGECLQSVDVSVNSIREIPQTAEEKDKDSDHAIHVSISKAESSEVPENAAKMLHLFAERHLAEGIAGDLEEDFLRHSKRFGSRYARRWYWLQVATVVYGRLKTFVTVGISAWALQTIRGLFSSS